jgi:hypothetical protein
MSLASAAAKASARLSLKRALKEVRPECTGRNSAGR